MNDYKYKIRLIVSMLIFGTIGLFVRKIDLPSSMIAVVRGFVGFFILLVITLITKKHISFKDIKKQFFILVLSGAFIGANWILLFESYRYTTIAVSTLCYYMAPVFFIILSSIIFKEKPAFKKIICVFVSLAGMVLVSGVLEDRMGDVSNIKGVLCALCAALLYACVAVINKKIRSISANDKTIVQLFAASVVILPYCILMNEFKYTALSEAQIVLLICLGVVHTGIAYLLYLGSVNHLSAQSAAILSYIDPITAVILSVIVLKEKPTALTAVGTVLIICSALVSEINFNCKKKSIG